MTQVKRWLPAALVFMMPLALATTLTAQARRGGGAGAQNNLPVKTYVLKPARVFDGDAMHEGWVVVVRGQRIESAGPAGSGSTPADAETVDLAGATLLPGLIEAHSHVLLHPYNETTWNDQVEHEPLALRIARATVSLKATLDAGFTTIRDLGTEGAGYADVGLKQALNQGIIPGPRMLVVTRAIVATGTYGPNGQAEATFTQAEMNAAVETAHSLGRPVAVHTSTTEGLRRAIAAGVDTIEHGDGGTPELFKMMADHNIALCPTLAATDATSQYAGWNKSAGQPEPGAVERKRQMFKLALDSGVTIASGSDVGVFTHGDNAREIELMANYGMPALDALKAATSVDAKVLHLEAQIGRITQGLQADLVGVDGDPAKDLSVLHKVKLVMKAGVIVKRMN